MVSTDSFNCHMDFITQKNTEASTICGQQSLFGSKCITDLWTICEETNGVRLFKISAAMIWMFTNGSEAFGLFNETDILAWVVGLVW